MAKVVKESEVKTDKEVKKEKKALELIKITDRKELSYDVEKETDIKEMSKKQVEDEVKSLEKIAIDAQSLLAVTLYPIELNTQQDLNHLLKFVEKDIPWEHNNAALLVSLYQSFKKAKSEGLDEDNNIWLLGRDSAHIYNTLLQRKGTGYYEAKSHIKLLTLVGESITKSMKQVADDNQIIRDIHTRLAALDTRIQEIAIEESGVKSENVEEVKAKAAELDKSEKEA